MTYEQTREQFLLAWSSNAYLNMCESDDMHNAIVAIEKQIAKEHHHTKVFRCNSKARESICPSCLGAIITAANEYPKHCTWCGQKIDWSDING